MADTSNWKTLPGNFDPLHARDLQPGELDWDIPVVPFADPALAPDWFMAYDDWIPNHRRGKQPVGHGGVHFFTDDYRFESCWNNPARAVSRMPGATVVCSPDFSMYRDWPQAMQLWNVYRSRWLGAKWASLGLNVIPTVAWSDRRSFSYCFNGLTRGTTVAVSTVGTQGADKSAASLFLAGYEAMIDHVRPQLVVVHGEKVPQEVIDLSERPDQDTGKPWAIKRVLAWQQEMRLRVAPPVAPPIPLAPGAKPKRLKT